MMDADDGWNGVGGYMGAKNRKLQQQFEEDGERLGKLSNIFERVSVYVNGYTQPTANEIKQIMAQHGGKFSLYYSRRFTTHIIAQSLAGVKLQNLKPDQKVVKPKWIVDCLNAKSLLPIKPYILAAHGNTDNQQKSLSNMFINQPSTSLTSVEQQQPSTSTSNRKLGNITATTSENFISEFYSRSRLHFLSTWKMKLIDYIRMLRQENHPMTGYEELVEKLPKTKKDNNDERIIMHIDMDCFFVAASLLSHPHLVGKPVAVTHRSNANQGDQIVNSEASCSEIASCSYEARQEGVRNGMYFGQAKQLCPSLKAVPYDFATYERISLLLYQVVASYTHSIEAVSCDELFIDLSDLVRKVQLSPLVISQHMRERIEKETGCSASAGIGPNISLAKMATKKGKPNGQHQVFANQAEEFISDLPVKELPGVGRKTESRLEMLGVYICSQLRCLTIQTLKSEFGAKTGKTLFDLCRGLDDREVDWMKERKSVSVDINYGIRLKDDEESRTFINNLSKELSERLKREKLSGRKLTLKVKVRSSDAPINPTKYGGHGMCKNISTSKLITKSICDSTTISMETYLLLKSLKVDANELRGIGIQMTSLERTDGRKGVEKLKSPPKTSSITKFLKKSPVKRALFQTDDQSTVGDDVIPLPDEDDVIMTNSRDAVEESNKQERLPDASFLGALPEDIRDEIENNLKEQKEALHRVMDGEATSTSTIDKSHGIGMIQMTSLGRTDGQKGAEKLKSPPKTSSITKFLKKSPVKRALFQTDDQSTVGDDVIPIPDEDDVIITNSRDSVEVSNKQERLPDASFLGALPEDIRDEIENNLKEQKEALHRVRQQKKSVIPPPPQSITSSSRNFFHARYGTNKIMSSKKAVKKRRYRTKQAKKVTTTTGLKITDHFRAVKSSSPSSQSTISTDENTSEYSEKSNSVLLQVTEWRDTRPSLGGARDLKGIREAVRRWTEHFADSYPLERDVNDVEMFLRQTTLETVNLELASQVVKTLHRNISRFILSRHNDDIDDVTSISHSWRIAYQNIVHSLQEAVAERYGNSIVALPSL